MVLQDESWAIHRAVVFALSSTRPWLARIILRLAQCGELVVNSMERGDYFLGRSHVRVNEHAPENSSTMIK
jgi:hypothetical protein